MPTLSRLCCRSREKYRPDHGKSAIASVHGRAGAVKSDVPLLRQLNQDAAVFLLVGRGLLRRDERLRRPRPARLARQFHSLALERSAHRFRAGLGKFLIRLRGAVGIGMALGADMQVWNRRQRLGIAGQDFQEPADPLRVAGGKLRFSGFELELSVFGLLVGQGFIDLVEQRTEKSCVNRRSTLSRSLHLVAHQPPRCPRARQRCHCVAEAGGAPGFPGDAARIQIQAVGTFPAWFLLSTSNRCSSLRPPGSDSAVEFLLLRPAFPGRVRTAPRRCSL